MAAGVKERVRKSGRERWRVSESESEIREGERDPFWSAVSFRVGGSHAPVGVHVPSAITNRKTRLPRTGDTFLG